MKTGLEQAPVFDYADGEVHFVSIINKHYQRPLTDEVRDLLAQAQRTGNMFECDMSALIRWLRRDQDDLRRSRDVSLLPRKVKLTDSLKQAISQ